MMSRSRKLGILLATFILGLGLTLSSAWAASQSYTGQVSDAMCGANHMMEGSAADCTRACVAKGSKYALVVGSKVYTLDSGDKAVLAALDKLAGEKAKVTGTADGDTITVSSVTAVK
ncbi:MAG: hypothetical protein WB421_10075 [Terriglobales bacterium]